MTTITEILAEAFNRVKSEHGVTLSQVEYVDTGGVLGLNFKAAGSVKRVHPVPAPNTPPYGATHYGSLEGGVQRYYRYVDGKLYAWCGWEGWRYNVSLSDVTDSDLVDQLTPVANPA